MLLDVFSENAGQSPWDRQGLHIALREVTTFEKLII